MMSFFNSPACRKPFFQKMKILTPFQGLCKLLQAVFYPGVDLSYFWTFHLHFFQPLFNFSYLLFISSRFFTKFQVYFCFFNAFSPHFVHLSQFLTFSSKSTLFTFLNFFSSQPDVISCFTTLFPYVSALIPKLRWLFSVF